MKSIRCTGFLLATTLFCGFVATSCTGRSRAAELFPEVAEHQGAEVKEIRFVGHEPMSEDTLHVLIESEATHCNILGLPICLPFLGKQVRRLNAETVRRDVATLSTFYRAEGYFGTRVTPRAEPEAAGAEDVVLTFVVRRGDPITTDSLAITGLAGTLDSAAVLRAVPLQRGELFDLGQFDESADYVLLELQRRGHAYADVLRNYTVDTIADLARATITAIPGPIVRVDSIIITGAERIGRGTTVRQLGFRQGDILRLNRLVESQRNLYSMEIVQLASVNLAPDSLQLTPDDSTTATILVAVAEAPLNQAEAAIGYGDVECFRVEGEYVNRSFMGSARRLAITTSLSKIGLGGATNVGLGGNVCRAFAQDTFENDLDYRVAVDMTQPFFLTPRNNLTLNLYMERQSEPNIFSREAKGGRFAVNRRLAPRTVLSASIDIERASTLATPVLFCTAFQVCTPDDLERMDKPRYKNSLGLNYVQDRTDNPLDPARGHVLRSSVAWAAPWLGSKLTFTRWTGEAAMYRTLQPGWVFAGSLRLGNFFRTATLNPSRDVDDFLPPEERFYAGGSNTVRGYQRNFLGPGVYVTTDPRVQVNVNGEVIVFTCGEPLLRKYQVVCDAVGKQDVPRHNFVPVGGTSLGIVNTELRFPSPLLRRQMRLAAFIDGGAIASANVWNMDASDWRFTPGIGARLVTPVGPIRVDVAYNPYDPVAGPLFLAQGDTIVQVVPDFRPPTPNFWQRLRVHVGIGQAF